MTDFPITPPPELVQQWEEDWHHSKVKHIELEPYIAAQASQWGADQELEACCEWLHWQNLATHSELIPSLRAARRPKPPSLKEQALTALERYMTGETILTKDSLDTIRRALEQLPE
jgi:hypothetical protein